MKTYPAISFSICLILAVAACDSKKKRGAPKGPCRDGFIKNRRPG